MKRHLTILLLISALAVNAQTEQENVIAAMRQFHKAMIEKNLTAIGQFADNAMNYGHSNGWVETKPEFVKDIDSGKITYNNIIEDSVKIVIDGNLASVRFNADFDVTIGEKTDLFHLRVLEIWIKKGKQWLLFARHAAKI